MEWNHLTSVRSLLEAAEALQRAAIAANGGNLEGACVVLSEMEASLSHAPATLAGDPLCRRLARIVGGALGQIDRVASEALPESDPRRGSSLSVGERHAAGNHGNPNPATLRQNLNFVA